jgi:ribonuclease H / adenosylcobalamin/alpha-ribazole phosphatase
VRVIVEADGGARGNPGPAGYGAVVRDAASGEVLAERSASLGVTTNNVAEYSGLIAGLRAAAELGATEVEVRLDSKLVVEQMSGRWRVRQPHLQPLASEAATLVRRLHNVRFRWIPRERNTHADRLANEAMDGAAAADQEGESSRSPAAAAQTAPPAAWRGLDGEPPTRFLLLRHGQTELSLHRRYSGRSDPPLTALGEQQAALAAKRLSSVPGVSAVVSSPLSRAVQTAEPVAAQLGFDVTVHNGLVESDFGDWEGLTFAEAAGRDPELHARWLSDAAACPPGGESVETVRRRVRKARDELIRAHGGTTVVIVSHVAPIKTLLAMALDAWPSVLFRLHLDLASLSIAEFYTEGASVRLVNDTSHLG